MIYEVQFTHYDLEQRCDVDVEASVDLRAQTATLDVLRYALPQAFALPHLEYEPSQRMRDVIEQSAIEIAEEMWAEEAVAS